MSTGIIAIAAALAIAISTIGPGIGQGLAAALPFLPKFWYTETTLQFSIPYLRYPDNCFWRDSCLYF